MVKLGYVVSMWLSVAKSSSTRIAPLKWGSAIIGMNDGSQRRIRRRMKGSPQLYLRRERIIARIMR